MTKDLKTPSSLSLTTEDREVGLKFARVGLGKVDYQTDTLRCDALAAEYFGLPAGMDVPCAALHARIHPDDWPEVREGLDCLLSKDDAMEVLDMTHRIVVPDAPLRWVKARKKVTFDGQGAPVSGVFALVDTTAEVLAEEQAKFLIGELNHRAKNLITVVSGIVRQLGRHAAPEEVVDKLLERLAALGRNQQAMLQDMGSRFGLRHVIVEQIRPFDGRGCKRVTLEGPDLMISSNAAQILGMVTHELATNAAKYGALSVDTGRVEVMWSIKGENDPQFILNWTERGGPRVQGHGTPGFGMQVLTRLTDASLGARTRFDYDEAGLVFELRTPLAQLSEA